MDRSVSFARITRSLRAASWALLGCAAGLCLLPGCSCRPEPKAAAKVVLHLPDDSPLAQNNPRADAIDDLSSLPPAGPDNEILAAARFEPSGLQFPQGIEVTWTLCQSRPPDARLAIAVLDEANRRWLDTGECAVVSASGREAKGRLYHFSVAAVQDRAPANKEKDQKDDRQGPGPITTKFRRFEPRAEAAFEVPPKAELDRILAVYHEQFNGVSAPADLAVEAVTPDLEAKVNALYRAAENNGKAFKTIAYLISTGQISAEHSRLMAVVRAAWDEQSVRNVTKKSDRMVGVSDSGNIESGMLSDRDRTSFGFQNHPASGEWRRLTGAGEETALENAWAADWDSASEAQSRPSREAMNISSMSAEHWYPDLRMVAFVDVRKIERTIQYLRHKGVYFLEGPVVAQVKVRLSQELLKSHPNPRILQCFLPDGTKLPFDREEAARVLLGLAPALRPGHDFECAVQYLLELEKGIAKGGFESKDHLRCWSDAADVAARGITDLDAKAPYDLVESLSDEEFGARFPGMFEASVKFLFAEDARKQALHRASLQASAVLRRHKKAQTSPDNLKTYGELAKLMLEGKQGVEAWRPEEATPEAKARTTRQLEAAKEFHKQLAVEFALETLGRTADRNRINITRSLRGQSLFHYGHLAMLRDPNDPSKLLPESDRAKLAKKWSVVFGANVRASLYALGPLRSMQLVHRIAGTKYLGHYGDLEASSYDFGFTLLALRDYVKADFQEVCKEVSRTFWSQLGYEHKERAMMLDGVLDRTGMRFHIAHLANETIRDPGNLAAVANVVRAWVEAQGNLRPIAEAAAWEFVSAFPVLSQSLTVYESGIPGVGVTILGLLPSVGPWIGHAMIAWTIAESGYAIYLCEYDAPLQNNIENAIYRGFSGPETRSYDEIPPEFVEVYELRKKLDPLEARMAECGAKASGHLSLSSPLLTENAGQDILEELKANHPEWFQSDPEGEWRTRTPDYHGVMVDSWQKRYQAAAEDHRKIVTEFDAKRTSLLGKVEQLLSQRHADLLDIERLYQQLAGDTPDVRERPLTRPDRLGETDAWRQRVIAPQLERLRSDVAAIERQITDLRKQAEQRGTLLARYDDYMKQRRGDGSYQGGFYLGLNSQERQQPFANGLLKDIPFVVLYSPGGVVDFRAQFSPEQEARLAAVTQRLAQTGLSQEEGLKLSYEFNDLRRQQEAARRAEDYRLRTKGLNTRSAMDHFVRSVAGLRLCDEAQVRQISGAIADQGTLAANNVPLLAKALVERGLLNADLAARLVREAEMPNRELIHQIQRHSLYPAWKELPDGDKFLSSRLRDKSAALLQELFEQGLLSETTSTAAADEGLSLPKTPRNVKVVRTPCKALPEEMIQRLDKRFSADWERSRTLYEQYLQRQERHLAERRELSHKFRRAAFDAGELSVLLRKVYEDADFTKMLEEFVAEIRFGPVVRSLPRVKSSVFFQRTPELAMPPGATDVKPLPADTAAAGAEPGVNVTVVNSIHVDPRIYFPPYRSAVQVLTSKRAARDALKGGEVPGILWCNPTRQLIEEILKKDEFSQLTEGDPLLIVVVSVVASGMADVSGVPYPETVEGLPRIEVAQAGGGGGMFAQNAAALGAGRLGPAVALGSLLSADTNRQSKPVLVGQNVAYGRLPRVEPTTPLSSGQLKIATQRPPAGQGGTRILVQSESLGQLDQKPEDHRLQWTFFASSSPSGPWAQGTQISLAPGDAIQADGPRTGKNTVRWTYHRDAIVGPAQRPMPLHFKASEVWLVDGKPIGKPVESNVTKPNGAIVRFPAAEKEDPIRAQEDAPWLDAPWLSTEAVLSLADQDFDFDNAHFLATAEGWTGHFWTRRSSRGGATGARAKLRLPRHVEGVRATAQAEAMSWQATGSFQLVREADKAGRDRAAAEQCRQSLETQLEAMRKRLGQFQKLVAERQAHAARYKQSIPEHKRDGLYYVNVRTNEDFLANDREQADVLQQWEIPQTELRIGAEPAEALSDWRTALGFWRQAPPLHEKRREIRLAELTAWEARQRECLARDPPKAGDLPRYLNKIAKQVLSTRQGIQADCFSGLVRDHTSIARTAWLAGDWPACRDALLQALACRAERDANSADKSGISYAAVQTYDCLAEACAMLTGNRQQAAEYYHQARAKDPDGKGKGLDPSRLPDWWPDADQQAKPASSGAAQNQPPTDGTIAVPKVTGMIAEAARAAIEQAGLEARPELGDPAPPDRQETEVYEQRPSLGTPCRKGSPVYFKFFARRGE